MATVVHLSACPLDCPDTCSIAVTVTDGRIVDIDAAPGNPLTDGWICAKVKRHAERVYSPDRVMTPLVRIGPKGSGEFRPASWDEAIDVVASKMLAAVAEGGADAIVPFTYNSSAGILGNNGLTEQLFARLGATYVEHTICAHTNSVAWKSVYRGMLSADVYDVVHAKLVVIWGANPTVSNTHFPPLVHQAVAAGAKVAVIDPRRTAMAKRADLHLALRPGTDVVLAFAIARELRVHGWLDESFMAECTQGAEEFLTAADNWTVDRAAVECGLTPDAITELARWYGTTRPAFLRLGWGPERNANGGAACRAILALPALAGHFGVAGGGVMASLSGAAPISLRSIRTQPAGGWPRRRTLPMHRIGEWLNDPADPARVLFVQGANPVVMCPDQHAVLDAFARDDVFTVVHDQVMTDTARYADVVLPATTHYEADDLAGSYGSFAILPVNAVIDRVGESRTNDEVAAALGARLSVDLTAPISGIDRESLITDGGDLGPRVVRDRTVQFVDSSPTDGKARLAQPEVPSYHPIESAYPLALITPASSKLINSMFGEFQSPDPVIRLNPGDARSRSLAPGDQVRVFNDLGSLDLGCVIDADLRPGLVAMPKGIWLRRYGAQNVGINALIPATADDLAGGACFNDARVEVERLA